MKVTIDSDRCRGHGVCCVLSPDVFTLNEDGYAETVTSQVPAELEQSVQEAEASCPERAISTN